MRISPYLIFSAVISSAALHSRAEILVKNGDSIAFLGDSITQFGADLDGGYVRLVESGLESLGIDINVIPAGWSGNTSREMLGRLEKDVLGKKPKWMTLSCGVNDVMHAAVELEEYKKNVTAILNRCQQSGVKVILLTSTQIDLPVTNPANVKLAGYNEFLRETAKTRNLPLADFNVAMLAEQAVFEEAGVERSLTYDGVHMNIYGNMVMAKDLLATFGLNSRQLAAVQGDWNKRPDVYPLPKTPPSPGTGTGLTGQYFSDVSFTSLVMTQVDPRIRFVWGGDGPKKADGTLMSGVGPDNFSVRWTGQIQALEEGTYTITAAANDTAKVWIADLKGSPLIDKPVAGSNMKATFKMVSGKKYDIRIDYTDLSGNAEVSLVWTRPGLTWAFVPQTQLYPTTTTQTPAPHGPSSD